MTISEELAKDLDVRNVATRASFGGGPPLSYVEGHFVIREANRIFGWDGWRRETAEMVLIQNEHKASSNGKELWYVGYVCKSCVDVVNPSGPQMVTREGYGFGQGIDADQGRAHESAVKEAETDAMKRALMTFGDPLGLALYGKSKEHVAFEPAPATPQMRFDVATLAGKLVDRQLVPRDLALLVGQTVTRENIVPTINSWLADNPEDDVARMLDKVQERKLATTADSPSQKAWASFWRRTQELQYTEAQVHEIAGRPSLAGMNSAEMDSLLTRLRSQREDAS